MFIFNISVFHLTKCSKYVIMRSSKVLFTQPTDLSNFTEDGKMNNTIVHESMKMRRLRRAVEVSADMFLKQGFDNVKMSDIADESGVGVATLYRYFGTKTGIVIAAMTHLWNKLNDMFSGVFESSVFVSQTGLKQVKDLMRMYIVLFEAHKDFMRLLGEFDLMDRIINQFDDLEQIANKTIDFKTIDSKLEYKRETAMAYLSTAIKA